MRGEEGDGETEREMIWEDKPFVHHYGLFSLLFDKHWDNFYLEGLITDR